MSAILPSIKLDNHKTLAKYFMPHQLAWILAEDKFHARKQQVFALAEKSVRIGWTYADAFKNIRKRINFPNRDYLFATKDYPSALEYMRVVREFLDLFSFTNSVISHGEDYLKVDSRNASLTSEIKISYIKFDNRSRIIAFSAHPQAMAVYGGNVGLDEFAKHPNAELLWQTAQGRVTWGYDLAVWSSHEGDDTLFHQFAIQARSAGISSAHERSLVLGKFGRCEVGGSHVPPHPNPLPRGEGESQSVSCVNEVSETPDLCSRCERPLPHFMPSGERSREHCDCGTPIPPHLKFRPPNAEGPPSSIQTQPNDLPLPEGEGRGEEELRAQSHLCTSAPPTNPWNLYFRVTITDAIQLGLLHTINRTRKTALTPDQFIADCRARSGLEQIFQQAYMCNPVPGGASIVEWSAIERCRADYEIERLHLEHAQIIERFGEFAPHRQVNREHDIGDFIRTSFPQLFGYVPAKERDFFSDKPKFRLGFDVAASGQGDLAAIYIDEADDDDLWLRALFTCRTEDWHFIQTALFYFLAKLRHLKAAGDDTGLGKQICWEAANRFSYKFTKVNFSSKKHDLGFNLMNQLATTKKRFPKSEQDIASDYFALRKYFTGSKWAFSEGRNPANPHSHCDIAWAGALASHVHIYERHEVSAAVLNEDGTISRFGDKQSPEQRLLNSDDPRVWRPGIFGH